MWEKSNVLVVAYAADKTTNLKCNVIAKTRSNKIPFVAITKNLGVLRFEIPRNSRYLVLVSSKISLRAPYVLFLSSCFRYLSIPHYTIVLNNLSEKPTNLETVLLGDRID